MIEEIEQILVTNGIYAFSLHGIDTQTQICTCGKKECNRQGKHPYSKMNWKLLASSKREDIQVIFDRTKKKSLNVGIATGRKGLNGKYLVVVDIDDNSSDFAQKIIKTNTKTFSYKTGGGGYHFWFWSKHPVKNSVSLIAKKVDVRGTNGYVVIPPSNHVSGGKYEFVNGEINEIADLPNEIEVLLNIKKSNLNEEESNQVTSNITYKKRVKHEVPDLLKIWSSYSIQDIRELINSGLTKIPEGTRNHTIFRLLCSDRAMGATKQLLMNNSKTYRLHCENFPTVEYEELERIVESVMKYPPYDNSYENVNTKYINWISKNGIVSPENCKAELLRTDKLFFDTLKKSNTGCSLKTISLTREEFFKSKGIKHYSTYKPSALGLKLRSLGFERIRTSRCNLWNVDIENMIP